MAASVEPILEDLLELGCLDNRPGSAEDWIAFNPGDYVGTRATVGEPIVLARPRTDDDEIVMLATLMNRLSDAVNRGS